MEWIVCKLTSSQRVDVMYNRITVFICRQNAIQHCQCYRHNVVFQQSVLWIQRKQTPHNI